MITANFATHKARRETIDVAVSSIINQVDLVRVHYNDYIPGERKWKQYTGADFTDRSKFAHIQKGEIAFTCDDDLYYPADYVEVALNGLDRYKSIITFQGRVLLGTKRNYYKGHKKYGCLYQVENDVLVDVPGSGVSCFDTNKFMPDIWRYQENYMADLLLAFEAVRKGMEIYCLKHPGQWLKTIGTIDGEESIYMRMKTDQSKLNHYADNIYKLKR
jgi:hypothetical protein